MPKALTVPDIKAPSPGSKAGPFAKRNLRRWRTFTLIAVHLLFAIHFLHWKLHGRSLAPMEFSESLHTLHDGVITVGFLFAVAAVLATLAFGRYFCGWGCHILAIQDGCAWLLGKFGIKPRPLRSRTMALVPLGIMAYIYLWPQLLRILAHRAQPAFVLQGDAEGWGSLTTSHLFRAMPGPAFSIITLAVCGAAMVYFLGSRSFCYSVCPYGVFFGWADRFSPAGRLVLSGSCESCGLCSLNCKSGVKVIQELKQFGTVVDTNCLKSLDCVAGCPTGAIGVGFKIPWGFSGKEKKTAVRAKKRFDFTLGEEAIFTVVFLFTMTVYRGLYEIGIFLAGSIGVIGGAAAIRFMRAYRERLTAAPRGSGRKDRIGLTAPARLAMAAFLILTGHSAFVHSQTFFGDRLFGRPESAAACAGHLRLAQTWSLFGNADTERKLAITAASLGEWEESRTAFAHYLAGHPTDVAMRVQFGTMLSQAGNGSAAYGEYLSALVPDSLLAGNEEKPWRAMAHSFLAQRQALSGDTATAIRSLEAAVTDNPWDPSHYCNLGFLYIKMGDREKARKILAAAEAGLGPVPCVGQLSELIRGDKGGENGPPARPLP
ncbi:MAG: hypothetical protein JWO30_3116 [Fibrobacteres bacterium]|nr:hypothetical protein [Fibrobacterota bacterium]